MFNVYTGFIVDTVLKFYDGNKIDIRFMASSLYLIFLS